MAILPDESVAVFDRFALVSTRPTHLRFLVPLGAAITTTGRRTVANLLRTAGAPAIGHASSYRRVSSRARLSMFGLACALTRHVVSLLPAEGRIDDGHAHALASSRRGALAYARRPPPTGACPGT